MVPVKTLVYSRVSTDAQERDGTSLDTQERACVEYVESQEMLVVGRVGFPRTLRDENSLSPLAELLPNCRRHVEGIWLSLRGLIFYGFAWLPVKPNSRASARPTLR